MSYIQPHNREELCAALASKAQTDVFLAGGTDLLLRQKADLSDRGIISLELLDELRQIHCQPDSIVIGALCTHTAVAQHPQLRFALPALTQACGMVGSRQIRNRGTIGGSICNASPAGDLYPALLALDASAVVLDSQANTSLVPAAQLISPTGTLRLRHNQLITHFCFPRDNGPQRSAFAKLAERSTVSISRLNLAIWVRLRDGQITQARVALGAIAPRAIRCGDAESWLLGKTLPQICPGDLAGLLSGQIACRCAGRASAAYKARAVLGPVTQALADLTLQEGGLRIDKPPFFGYNGTVNEI